MKFDSSSIPQIDIIKSGYKPPVEPETEVEDGVYIISGRSRESRDARDRVLALEIKKQEDELKRLRKTAESYGLKDYDLKEARREAKEREYEKEQESYKKRDLDPYFESLLGAGVVPRKLSDYLTTGDEEYSKKKKKKDKKKQKKIAEERENIVGFKVKVKPDKFKKRELDPNNEAQKTREDIAKDFQEMEVISKSNLDQVNTTIAFVNSRLNELTENSDRIKNKDYIISNYLSSLATLISAKQGIAKDISANKAKIYELEIKQQKNKKEDAVNDADLISRLFPKMVLSGQSADIDDYIGEAQSKSEKKKKKKKKWKDEIVEDDELETRERELMDSGMLEYTDYEKNIEYEDKYDIVVYRNFQTDEFKFGALDKRDGHRINIPKDFLPSRKSVKLKFDSEQELAYDTNTGRTYKMIDLPVLPEY